MKKILLLGTICFTFLTGCLGSDVDQLFFDDYLIQQTYGQSLTCLDKVQNPFLEEERLSKESFYRYENLVSCVVDQSLENASNGQCHSFITYGFMALDDECIKNVFENCKTEIDICLGESHV